MITTVVPQIFVTDFGALEFYTGVLGFTVGSLRGARVLRAAGARREPWHGQGQGSFVVEDPDGNLLLFGGRTD